MVRWRAWWTLRSGELVSDYTRSAFERWMTNLHRSFFLGDSGRMAAGAGALAMLVLMLSGLQMTARRMGGWRHILDRARGNGVQRLHTDLGRLAAGGLLLSTLTALYLSLTTFGLISDGMSQAPAFPTVTTRGPALPVEQITALRGIDLSQLRVLTFPNPANPNDLFHLTTATGEGYVDPGGRRHAGLARPFSRPAYLRIHLHAAHRPRALVARLAAGRQRPRRAGAWLERGRGVVEPAPRSRSNCRQRVSPRTPTP